MNATYFTIESKPELELRTKYVSPIDILAITTTQMDFVEFAKTKEFYSFALEHVEVKVGEKWFPVKFPGRDVYTPEELETNIVVLNEIISWFLENIIVSAFPQSSE